MENPNNQSIQDYNQSIGDNNQLTDKQNQLIHSINGNSSTKEKARIVCEELCNDNIFGRTEIMKITGLSTSAAGLPYKLCTSYGKYDKNTRGLQN